MARVSHMILIMKRAVKGLECLSLYRISSDKQTRWSCGKARWDSGE